MVVNKLSRASWVVACTLAVLFCLGGAQISSAAVIEQSPRSTGQTVIITEDGDQYYPDGIRLTGSTRIVYPGAEELAARYSAYDGSENALCASSFQKAIWGARYGLATPLTAGGQIGISGMLFYLGDTLPVADLVLDLKICDDYSEAAGADPCQGTVLLTQTYDFGATTGTGGTFQIVVPVGPLVLDDGAGGGADPGDGDVTVTWTFRRGLGGPPAYNDVGMYFWCGAADVGNSGLTPYLFRDQNNDGVLANSGAAPGGGNDLRAPVAAGNSKWQVHFYGITEEPLHSALGIDLLQATPCSSWTIDPGNLFIYPGALDFSDGGDDCTVDSGFLSSDEFSGTIPLTGSPMNVDTDGDLVADNILGGNVDHALFRDRKSVV